MTYVPENFQPDQITQEDQFRSERYEYIGEKRGSLLYYQFPLAERMSIDGEGTEIYELDIGERHVKYFRNDYIVTCIWNDEECLYQITVDPALSDEEMIKIVEGIVPM